MKPLQIDYSLSSKKRTERILLSVCCVLIGIIAGYLVYVKTGNYLLIILVSIYLFFSIVFLIGQSILRYKKYISINTDAIEEKLSYWSIPQRIRWNEVRKITLEITNVNIELNTTGTKKINLARSSYSDVKNIKHHLFAWCLDKKIPCYVKTIKKKVD